MQRSRILILGLAIALSLVMLLWLVDFLLRLYTQLSIISGILANIVLILLLGLIGSLIAALIYYAILFSRPRQPRRVRPADLPAEKIDVAKENLDAVRQQVEQIQDEVARQVLQERSQAIAAGIARGDLSVVVFGTGSAGKTSIVNAILGRIAGEVGAPMGTTTGEQVYTLRLRRLERAIVITDTPGILEAGVKGTERERLARQQAADANLLLFVVDGDLRQSEFEPLQLLAKMGKRSLLILNKIDLITEADEEILLTQLRQRVQGLIASEDVIAIAANPQPVLLETGEWVKPEPSISPLLRRMAAILRTEGETLVADTIMLQTQRLGEETRQVIDAERRRQAEQLVERFQWIGAGVVSLTPIPGVDLLATAAVNAQMVVEIAKVYGCDINLERGKELALSLAKTLISLGIARGTVELLTLALETNVGTFMIGRALQGATAAYLTRIAGKSFIEYFRRDQDWGDGGITEIVQEQFQLNRRDEFIKGFIGDAIARVVKPLAEHEPSP
jgi:uncharacterized protein